MLFISGENKLEKYTKSTNASGVGRMWLKDFTRPAVTKSNLVIKLRYFVATLYKVSSDHCGKSGPAEDILSFRKAMMSSCEICALPVKYTLLNTCVVISLNNRLFRHRCHKKQNFLSIKGASER